MPEKIAVGHAGVVSLLGSPGMYPAHPAVTLLETHASWVFLITAQFHRFQALDELPAASVRLLDGEQRPELLAAEAIRAIDERMRNRASSEAAEFPRTQDRGSDACSPGQRSPSLR